jgi:RNA 2',3'-cyclic 3'-phosphodiesterase
MRLFVGIPLANALVRELSAVLGRLQGKGAASHDRQLRWTEPESWHITLQFLGNATAEQLECLKARLGEVRSATAFVQLGKLDCFDGAGVLFADIAVTPGLASLQQKVVAATGKCGFVAETRPFHPHITLARAKGQGRGTGLRKLLDQAGGLPEFAQFTAQEFVLYESHPVAGGTKYEIRQRLSLNQPQR